MLAIPAARASESGHWYDRLGQPVYNIIGANGAERKAHLGDARKLGLVPGVSSIIKCAAAPALTDWLIRETIKRCGKSAINPMESVDAYVERMQRKGDEGRDTRLDTGKAVHAALEDAYKGQPVPGEYAAHVTAARGAIRLAFPGVTDWVVEKSFAHPLGYGGRCDMYSPGSRIVVDFKTKDDFSDPTDRRRFIFRDHIMQTSAYAVGLDGRYGSDVFMGDDGWRTANLFLSLAKPGEVAFFEHSLKERLRGWDMFGYMLGFWQTDKEYDSSWEVA